MNFFITDIRGDIILMAEEDKFTAIASIFDKINIHYDTGIEQQVKFSENEREIIISEIECKGDIIAIEVLDKEDNTIILIDKEKVKCNSNTIGKFSFTNDLGELYEANFTKSGLFLFENLKKI